MSEDKEKNLFENAPVGRAYLSMAVPVVVAMVVSLVYNMTDTYFISLTGNTDLIAGISLNAPVFTMMIALGDIFGLGGSSVVSRLLGSGRYDRARSISSFCFYTSLLVGIVMTVVCLVAERPILTLLKADEATYPYASAYYRIIVLGAPLQILSNTPNNLLRTEGLARQATVASVIGTVVNIFLDPVFIFGLHMGAQGAAVATVIGTLCTDIGLVMVVVRKSQHLSVSPREMRISGQEAGAVMAIGIPACITNFMQSVGIAMTNRYLHPYGNEYIAVMGIVQKITMIAGLVLIGYSFGGQPMFGYNYGSGNRRRLKEVLRFAYLSSCGIALALTAVLSLAAHPLVGLFLKDADLAAMGVRMLRLQLLGMIFEAIVLITTCSFQSMGKAAGAFVLSLSRQGVVLIIMLAVLSYFMGSTGVVLSQSAADVITAVMAVVLMLFSFRKDPVLSGRG